MERQKQETSLKDRVEEYLPPLEILAIKPNELDFEMRRSYKRDRPGGNFSLVLNHDKLVMVPSWHPLNRTPRSANSVISGTGTIETLTLEPLDDPKSRDEIERGNIVLLGPRMDRLYEKSLPAREVELPINKGAFAQGIIDLMAISGDEVLINEKKLGIGSIRVTVGLGVGKFGKSALNQVIDASVETCYASKSFSDDAYNGTGIILAAGPNQRFQEFKGKHSSHYGEAGRIGTTATNLGAEDAIFFAPYYTNQNRKLENLSRFKNNPQALKSAMLNLAISNGLGAEILAIRKDWTILLPPMDVNRLGGVTAEYILQHLAPKLNIPVSREAFNLQQVLDGEIVGLFFAGNAARIAAIRQIKLHNDDGEILEEINLDIPSLTLNLIERYESEIRGKVSATDTSLITLVDITNGKKARETLMEKFTDWF